MFSAGHYPFMVFNSHINWNGTTYEKRGLFDSKFAVKFTQNDFLDCIVLYNTIFMKTYAMDMAIRKRLLELLSWHPAM